MKRRIFAKRLLASLTGFSLLPFLIRCSPKKLDLTSLIGQNTSSLRKKDKNGNDFFAYYTINGNELNSKAKAEEALIFARNGQIIGYTLVIDGTQAGEETFNELKNNVGEPQKIIDNDYGSQWKWQKGERTLALTIGNVEKGLPQKTWLSEYMSASDLIVF